MNISYTKIPCRHQNHRGMPLEYVYVDPDRSSDGPQLACLYCCMQYYNNHKQKLTTIKEVLASLPLRKEATDYQLLKMLLQGLQLCQNEVDLKTNMKEILAYRADPDRFEKLMDQQMIVLHNKTREFYQREHLSNTQTSLTWRSQLSHKESISPVLNFKQEHLYQLVSPFSVSAKQDGLVTVFAYPSLSKFYQSIDIKLKIEKYTPSWLAVGLSLGQSQYEQNSQRHALLVSNGWIAQKGVLRKAGLVFGAGNVVRIRWDKNMQLLEWQIKGKKQTVAFECKWNQEVYLCVCLFYKNDRVSILA